MTVFTAAVILPLTRPAFARPPAAPPITAETLTDAHVTAAIDAIVAVKALPNLSDATRHELSFWHGYSVFQVAVAVQEPRTLESARRALPMLREALGLLEDVGEYPASVGVTIESLRANVGEFVAVQEAIIRRGAAARSPVR